MKPRGFAAMDPIRRKEVSASGGRSRLGRNLAEQLPPVRVTEAQYAMIRDGAK